MKCENVRVSFKKNEMAKCQRAQNGIFQVSNLMHNCADINNTIIEPRLL